MGRHRTPEEKRELGERARAMRAQGRSRREISAELHVGEDLLQRLLAGTEAPASLRRARAKDELRERAVALRLAGATYDRISAELGVSKSSCSLWLRELPRPEDDPERRAQGQARRTQALRERMGRMRDARDAAGRARVEAAAAAVGPVGSSDLLLALAVSYWCEGSKRKPWNRNVQVQWMNSDPLLVRLFLEGLSVAGVPRERLVLRLHIHELADEPAARTWWSQETGVPLEQFRRSTIKRHNPRTVRHNVGEHYRGCLSVSVLQSRQLYELLEGLVLGLAEQSRLVERWQDGSAAPVGHQDGRQAPSAVG